MKLIATMLLSAPVLLAAVVWLESRMRQPNCPRCRSVAWSKSILADWTCGQCGILYDPISRETRWLPEM